MKRAFSDRVSFAALRYRTWQRVALAVTAVAAFMMLTSCNSESKKDSPATAQTTADIDAPSGQPYNVPIANMILWTRGMNSKNIYVCLVDQNPANSPFNDGAVSWDLSLLTSKLTSGFKNTVAVGNQFAVQVYTIRSCAGAAAASPGPDSTPHIIIVKN
jgi:hypothetical protein